MCSCGLGLHRDLCCILFGCLPLIHALTILLQDCFCTTRHTVASLDIERVYHNSPIMPIHKPYLAVPWKDKIFVGHVAVEGLATTSGIQGTPADRLLDILHFHNIKHVFIWV